MTHPYQTRCAALSSSEESVSVERYYDRRSALNDGKWQGHRTCLVDGSGCSVPDTPALQDTFGSPSGQRPGGGVPMARLLGPFHAGIGVLLTWVAAPLLTHDLAQVHKCTRCDRPEMCWWRIGACVPTLTLPSSCRLVCTPCGESAGVRSWTSGPAGICQDGREADAGSHRCATVPLAQRTPHQRPTGSLVETRDLSLMVHQAGIGCLAKFARAARGVLRRRQTGDPTLSDHPGDDAPRRAGLPGC
jgi:hypothetical protein